MKNAKQTSIGKLINRGIRNELITSVIMLAVGLMFMGSAIEEDSSFTFVFALAFLGGGAYFGWRCVRHYRDRNMHPLMRELSRYGNIEEVEKSISAECESPIFAKNAMILTPSWAIQKNIYGATLIHANDILWAYKKVTKHSVNFIPTGKTYATMILADKDTIEVALSDEETLTLLTEIANRFPWVVLGYSKEIQQLWDKDRHTFVAAIQKRIKGQGSRSFTKEKEAPRYCSDCGKEVYLNWKFCKSCGESLA